MFCCDYFFPSATDEGDGLIEYYPNSLVSKLNSGFIRKASEVILKAFFPNNIFGVGILQSPSAQTWHHFILIWQLHINLMQTGYLACHSHEWLCDFRLLAKQQSSVRIQNQVPERVFLFQFFQILIDSRSLVPSRSSPILSRAHRLGPSDDEMYQRTTVTVMQKESDNALVIYSYSPEGFNIDGNKVFGPCAVVPPTILQWNVKITQNGSTVTFVVSY